MHEEKGLSHWKSGYPKKYILNDINNKNVFLVKNKSTNEFINTFQIDFSNQNYAELNKFATLPVYSGKGIGTQVLEFNENYILERNKKYIRLDVYDKSIDAIDFYKKEDLLKSKKEILEILQF